MFRREKAKVELECWRSGELRYQPQEPEDIDSTDLTAGLEGAFAAVKQELLSSKSTAVLDEIHSISGKTRAL